MMSAVGNITRFDYEGLGRHLGERCLYRRTFLCHDWDEHLCDYIKHKTCIRYLEIERLVEQAKLMREATDQI